MAQRKRTQQNMFMGPAMGVGSMASAALKQPGVPKPQAQGFNPFKGRGQAGTPPPPGQGVPVTAPGVPPAPQGGMPQMPPPPQLPPITGDDMIETQGSFGGAVSQDTGSLMELLAQLGMGGAKGTKVY